MKKIFSAMVFPRARKNIPEKYFSARENLFFPCEKIFGNQNHNF